VIAIGDTRSLVVERLFSHPPEKLWRALTEGPLLSQWMMTNDFAPVPGHRFQFRAAPVPGKWDGIVDCEVIAVEPPLKLSYYWGIGGEESGMQWIVEWTLAPASDGTHLRMEQSGFTASQNTAYGGAKYGWQIFFNNLDRILGGLE
jgi:uncharacterized protein YndB with AHSA1/START domain